MRRNFVLCLLHGLRPGAEIVPQLIGREIFRGKPAAGFESDHIETGLRERQHGDAAGRAETDHHDVSFFQSRHASQPPSGL